jgi:hypothetical protein
MAIAEIAGKLFEQVLPRLPGPVGSFAEDIRPGLRMLRRRERAQEIAQQTAGSSGAQYDSDVDPTAEGSAGSGVGDADEPGILGLLGDAVERLLDWF